VSSLRALGDLSSFDFNQSSEKHRVYRAFHRWHPVS
jgi:hypothetical protein